MSSLSSPDSLHPTELRHMTSSVVLTTPVKESNKDHRASRRISQHLRTSDARVGSRSPSSIPSSPTSVHSSSSAIFERDIEPIVSPSPPHPHQHHPLNPHRIPRSKATEHSVPSVLDSAASILAGLEDTDTGDQIAVVTPASSVFDAMGRSSGLASPIGSFRSRSPSPLGTRVGALNNRTSLLLSIPHHSPAPSAAQSAATPSSPPNLYAAIMTSTSAATPGTEASTPSIVTPTSAYFSTTSSAPSSSSPTTTTREHPPHLLPEAPLSLPSAVLPPTATASHPPSPNAANKRLSFMSYSDLLSSTPASTFPLSSLTTSASMIEPPPHIPSVSGLTQASAQAHLASSAAASLRGFVIGGPGSRDIFDDVGGEWEREGLGRGLEERLEALMPVPVGGHRI